MRFPRSTSWWVVVVLWWSLAATVLTRPYWNAFAWDSFGYHLYLPAFVQHHDPALADMSWVEQAHREHDVSSSIYQITERDGHRVIRYTMGLALAWSPWYLLGHGIAKVVGVPADGYSPPYQWSVVIGVLCYLLIGLFWLRRTLLAVFDERVTAITIAVLLVGTNLIEQVLTNITGPHTVLFALYCGILHFTVRWHASFRVRDAIVLAVLMGLAALSRPTDLVCVLIPLCWGEGPRAVFRHWKHVLLAVVIIALIGTPQLLYWHAITGHYFYDSYGNAGEGLDLFFPHTFDFLFSFRKGWWLYTPVMLLATTGIFLLRKRWPQSFFSVSVFFAVNLWLLSSWTCWWYADSFGSRAMTGSYPVMALPLAAVVSWAFDRKGRKFWALGLLTLLTGWSLFQYKQFTKGIIDPQRMTRAAYMAVLGRTTKPPNLQDLLLVDRYSTRPDPRRHHRVETPAGLFEIPATDRDTVVPWIKGSLRATRLDKDHPFTPAIRIPFERLTIADHVWVECSWQVLVPDSVPWPHWSIVTAFEHDGESYSYRAEDVPDAGRMGRWGSVSTFYLSPEVRDRQDPFVVYAWLRDTVPLLVSDPVIHLHQPIQQP